MIAAASLKYIGLAQRNCIVGSPAPSFGSSFFAVAGFGASFRAARVDLFSLVQAPGLCIFVSHTSSASPDITNTGHTHTHAVRKLKIMNNSLG